MGLFDKLLNKEENENNETKHYIPAAVKEKDLEIREKLENNQECFAHYDKTGKLVFYHIETYDDEGKLIHKTAYDGGNTMMGDYDVTYNEFGSVLESCWFFYGSGFLMKLENRYDENNRTLETYWHGDEKRHVTGHKTFYYYGDDGRMKYSEVYDSWHEDDSHGEVSYTYRYWNDKGQLERTDTFDARMNKICEWGFEYDERGNRTREVYVNDQGLVDYYNVFTYDENNKKVDTKRYDRDGNLMSTGVY